MNTIFLTSFHPLISRNILMSGLLSILTKERRVVLFVPAKKTSYFKENFSGPNVVVEGVPTELGSYDLSLRKVALALTNTRALYIKKRTELYRDGKVFSFLASVLPGMLFGRFRFLVRAIRAFDCRAAKGSPFAVFFERYHPERVFSTDVQNELDVSLLREAKRRKVKTVGMIRSWDNLTSKGILRLIPDRLLVGNEVIRSEAIGYNFVDPKSISIIGIPHYDRYVAEKARLGTSDSRSERERAAFFSSMGFDTAKQLILFAPFGDRYIRGNQTDILILKTLSDFDLNILVRLPPTDTVNFEGFSNGRANVKFYRSGNRAWSGGEKLNEISEADEEHLIQSLFFADLVVTGQSTVAIDAAVFDKPVIAIAFDHEPRVYWDSVKRYYDYEYYDKFRKVRSVRFADSPDDLSRLAKAYLENPALDRVERQQAATMQAYRLDGNATKLLADILLAP